MGTFLPKDYEKPTGNSDYFKFEQGDNKFRVMSSAIVGYEYWTTKDQPVRSKEQFEATPDIKTDQSGKKRIKHFWAFIVWCYRDNKPKIMQITQTTIQDAIYALHSDEGWGDPKGYDINVNRKGEKIETTYNVIPTPPIDTTEEMRGITENANIKLEALFSGGDPFASVETQDGAISAPTSDPTQEVEEDIKVENIPF